MRDANGAADKIGDSEYLIHLIAGDAQFVAGAEVVPDAIIAAKHHGGYQTQELLGFGVQRTILIGVGIQIEEALEHLVILSEDFFIHLRPIVVKFSYY